MRERQEITEMCDLLLDRNSFTTLQPDIMNQSLGTVWLPSHCDCGAWFVHNWGDKICHSVLVRSSGRTASNRNGQCIRSVLIIDPIKWDRDEEAGMGTREVYEEKLRSGNLHHDPTINPGLGSARCPRCLSLIRPKQANGEWTITTVLHDATAVAGSGIGGMLSAVHGFNTGIPFIQKHVKGPKWLQFLIGLPPFLAYSAGSAVFGAYALPKFAQLSVTSYYAASSASHYGVSRITRLIERAHSHGSRENPR